jgi:hypothetical protein
MPWCPSLRGWLSHWFILARTQRHTHSRHRENGRRAAGGGRAAVMTGAAKGVWGEAGGKAGDKPGRGGARGVGRGAGDRAGTGHAMGGAEWSGGGGRRARTSLRCASARGVPPRRREAAARVLGVNRRAAASGCVRSPGLGAWRTCWAQRTVQGQAGWGVAACSCPEGARPGSGRGCETAVAMRPTRAIDTSTRQHTPGAAAGPGCRCSEG